MVKCEKCIHFISVEWGGKFIRCYKSDLFLMKRPDFCKFFKSKDDIRKDLFGPIYCELKKGETK